MLASIFQKGFVLVMHLLKLEDKLNFIIKT